MFRNIILLVSISSSLIACGGSGKTPTSITQANATSVSKAVLQQVTGVAKQAQMAGSKKSAASSKSTAKVGITIEQSLTILDISTLTEAMPSCANSGQENMRYVVNSDISLNCDFVVKPSSQLEINNASFTVAGLLTLSNVIGTGNVGITTENNGIDINGANGVIITNGNLTLTTNNGNLEIHNTGGVESATFIGVNGSFSLELNATTGGSISLGQVNLGELSASISSISSVTFCDSRSQAKSQVRAGITIEEGFSTSDLQYEYCPETSNSSTSSGTGITIAENFTDLLISICLNADGEASFNYNDSNNNSTLDLGEASHANYTNCQFSDTLSYDGKQSITVTEFSPSYKSTITNDNYSITENGTTSTSNGSVSLSASDANGVQSFRSEFKDFSETVGIETSTLHSGFIETSFTNATYEMQQDTVISGSSFTGKLSIKTGPSLKGVMLNGELQAPSSGKLQATAEDGSYIIIDTDDGDNNADTFNLTVSNGATLTTVQKWSEL